MAEELRAFITAVLASADADRRPDVALEVFNTPVSGTPDLAGTIRQVLDNPLNAVAPLIHGAGPAGRPLYIVHGADGEVGWFLRHLRGLTLPRPVYGVVAPPWYGEAMPGSLRLLAGRHLQAVRAAQPAGPYTLGGYSAGAPLALEMAAQLEAAGQEVDGLLLIDPVTNADRLQPADVVYFRLHQLRQRRHPVMAPYFALADRSSEPEVLSALERMIIPADPIGRRFYRGLTALVGLLAAPPLSLRPVRPGRCTIVGTQPSELPGAGGPAEGPVIESPVRFCPIPGPHARMFEQPALHQAITEFLS
jgi:thioesterase domain-containing protein